MPENPLFDGAQDRGAFYGMSRAVFEYMDDYCSTAITRQGAPLKSFMGRGRTIIWH